MDSEIDPNMYDTVSDRVHELLWTFGKCIPDFNQDASGLEDTPSRVAKAYLDDWLAGYRENPDNLFTDFEGDGYKGIVLVRDIPFYSMCEHHLAPFFGSAHVGYIPNPKTGRIVGLSKLARLVDVFSRRLQVQERITSQVVEALEKNLQPLGAMCILRARHLCMESRGIRKAGNSTVTSEVTGVFADKDNPARQEFLELLKVSQ